MEQNTELVHDATTFDSKVEECANNSVGVSSLNSDTVGSSTNDTEEVSRNYEFYSLDLPVLDDAKNYNCGKFQQCFWHQNADQVFVYVPIPESLNKREISATFEVHRVQLMVGDEELLSFNCPERIIPDGSFWIIERDCNDKRYIQIDLEKRFRMINWNRLFGTGVEIESNTELSGKRSKMLEKLLAANKGMSKVTGLPPETLTEMIKDETLLHALTDIDKPRAYVRDENGEEISVDPSAVPPPKIFSRDQSIVDLLENRSLEDRLKSLSSTLVPGETDAELEKEIELLSSEHGSGDENKSEQDLLRE